MMRRLTVLLALVAVAPALAQGPPPPPPPPDPVWAATEGPPYISYRCDGGFVLFRSDAGADPAGTLVFWLDDEAEVRTLVWSEADGAFADGTYTARHYPEPYVRRDGVVVREHCVQDQGAPVAQAEGRPGVRIAWARMNPKPLTTYLRTVDGGDAYWVGADLLVLDSTTVASVTVGPDQAPGYARVDVTLTPEAAGVLEAATTAHLHQPLAFLSDGVLLLAPRVMEPIRGGTFTLSVPQHEAARLAAVLSP